MAAAVLDGFSGYYELVGAFMATFVCIGALSVVTCSIFSQLPRETGMIRS